MASPPELFVRFASRLFSSPLDFASATVSQMVCLVLNHLLNQQQESKRRLQSEAGKLVAISIAPVSLNLRVNQAGYFQSAEPNNNVGELADTRISMEWADLIGSVSNPNSISRKAVIEGDMDFAQTVSSVLNNLTWDPEHDLARVLGDAQAVWVMNALSAFGTNARDVVQRFKNNLREYVVHEKSLVPTVSEFDLFRGDISKLRDEVSRLEKRLARLGKQ